VLPRWHDRARLCPQKADLASDAQWTDVAARGCLCGIPFSKLAKTKVHMRTILAALGRLLRVRRASADERTVEEMERQVAVLREKIRYLQVMAMRPGQSSKDLERLRWLERAARTAVKLRISEIALRKDSQALPSVRTRAVDRRSQTSEA